MRPDGSDIRRAPPPYSTFAIYVVNADGGDLRRVTPLPSEMDEAVGLFASAQTLFEQTGSALTGSDAMLFDELQRKLGAARLPR